MHRLYTALLAPAALLSLTLIGCASLPFAGPDLRRVELPARGVALAAPDRWIVRQGDFFHLQARAGLNAEGELSPLGPDTTWESARGPGGVAQFDYRGLEKSRRSLESKRQYALGWYKAIALSYPNWTYDSQTADDPELAPEGAFRFEGVYLDEGVRYRKIGILRFVGDRVHALYYTAPDEHFDDFRALFQEMDESHSYLPVSENKG